MNLNLRRHTPHLVRHINRAEPLAVIPRRKPRIEHHEDGTWSIHNMPHGQLMRLYELTQTSRNLYPLTYHIEQLLGEPHADDGMELQA